MPLEGAGAEVVELGAGLLGEAGVLAELGVAALGLAGETMRLHPASPVPNKTRTREAAACRCWRELKGWDCEVFGDIGFGLCVALAYRKQAIGVGWHQRSSSDVNRPISISYFTSKMDNTGIPAQPIGKYDPVCETMTEYNRLQARLLTHLSTPKLG